jgi:DNA uptake protein ComE-like DNA-binding protein
MNRKTVITILASMALGIILAGFAGAQAQKGATSDDNLLDLNSASLEKLMTLTEVDLMTARKIVAGRPYANKAQVVQKKVMTQEAFDKISRQVTVKVGGKTAAEPAAAPAKKGAPAKGKKP